MPDSALHEATAADRVTGDGRFVARQRHRLLHQMARNHSALTGAGIVCLFVIVAGIAFFWTPYDPTTPVLAARLQGPSLAHFLGTDELGRDILSRIAVGARYSLTMGIVAMAIACVLGIPCGLLAGYRGGWWDIGIMRGIDVLLTIPSIVLAIAIVSVLGPGIASVIIAVSVTSIPAFARLSQAVTLLLREQDFVVAARVAGARDSHILTRHLLPNALPPLIVQASLGVGTTVLTAAALGFLGLGVQPPAPEWGAMLSRGRTYISSSPHLVLFPGLAIALVVLGFNLLGDSLRDALDPRLQQFTR